MRRFVPLLFSTAFGIALASTTGAQPPSKSSLEATGLIIKPSPYTVQETSERLNKVLTAKGLTIFANIYHSENAAKADLELPATTVVLFGNPKLGTPLMQCSPSIAIDLPQKILIWKTEQGTQLAYNNPAYLSGRHRLRGCGQNIVTKISNALNGITNAAIKAD